MLKRPARFFAGFVFLPADAFAFEQVEEALDDRIIPTVPAAAHAGNHIVLLWELLPLAAGELQTLIGVHVDLSFMFAPPDGHQQSLQRQVGTGAAPHYPMKRRENRLIAAINSASV